MQPSPEQHVEGLLHVAVRRLQAGHDRIDVRQPQRLHLGDLVLVLPWVGAKHYKLDLVHLLPCISQTKISYM